MTEPPTPPDAPQPEGGLEAPESGSDSGLDRDGNRDERFNPFQNEPDMFKVLLAVVAICVVAICVKYAIG